MSTRLVTSRVGIGSNAATPPTSSSTRVGARPPAVAANSGSGAGAAGGGKVRRPATSSNTSAVPATRQTLLDFPLTTPPTHAASSSSTTSHQNNTNNNKSVESAAPAAAVGGGGGSQTSRVHAVAAVGSAVNAAVSSRAQAQHQNQQMQQHSNGEAGIGSSVSSGPSLTKRPLTARGTKSSVGLPSSSGGNGGRILSGSGKATGFGVVAGSGAASSPKGATALAMSTRGKSSAGVPKDGLGGGRVGNSGGGGDINEGSLREDGGGYASSIRHQHFLDREGEVPFVLTPPLIHRTQRASCGYHSSQVTGIPSLRFRSDFDKAALRFAANEHGLFEIVGGALLVGEHHHNPMNYENNNNKAASKRPTTPPTDTDTSPTSSPLSTSLLGPSFDRDDGTPTTSAAQPQPVSPRAQRYEWTGLHLNSYTGPWNFFWGSVQQVRAMFDGQSNFRLRDDQIINHFPNHVELTRKDLMYKNIRRFLRENTSARGGGNAATFGATADGPTNPATGRRLAECVPVTFSLPNDLSLFTEEYKKTPGQTWIIKPSNRSQGKGIFLINRFAQLQSWLREKAEEGDRDPYIASRYVSRPLLIAGKKFDLRLYVLVLNYKPLVAYWHEEGFARFCSTLYTEPKSSVDISDEPLGAHLTNVAFQKGEEDYNDSHGGKWTLKNLWLFVEGAFGHAEANGMLSDIQFLILNTLLSVQNMVHNDKHAFELYGYDILLDDELRPHLIEVNASPSLRITTFADRALKGNVLLDTFRLVCPVHRHAYDKPPASGIGGGGGRGRTTSPPPQQEPQRSATGQGKTSSPTSPSTAATPQFVPPPFVYTPAYNQGEVPFAEYKRRPDLQAPFTGGFHLIDASGR